MEPHRYKASFSVYAAVSGVLFINTSCWKLSPRVSREIGDIGLAEMADESCDDFMAPQYLANGRVCRKEIVMMLDGEILRQGFTT